MTPSIRFLGQPVNGDLALGAVLKAILADPRIESFTSVVAWARFRGLARLQADIETFNDRGGASRLIVGIDEGGATRPGLLLAAELFTEALVFHDPAGGTFHPKMYLAEGRGVAILIVGSGNATPGGWFNNYEASLEARFALPSDSQHQALVDAHRYIDALASETELCLPLTDELTDRLVRNRRYRVTGHERRARSTAAEDADIDASGSSDVENETDRLFGSRDGVRVRAPALSEQAREKLASLEIPHDDEAESDEPLPPPATPAPVTAAAPPSSAAVVSSWSKVLPSGDAQHPPQGNPTGNIRLTQAKHDIPWLTWFREDLFAPASWSKDLDIHSNEIERVKIPFQVVIEGVPLGIMDLEVTYAPHRESAQRNHTTVLRWGPLLATLQANDYTSATLTLERLSDNSYRLDIS